MYYNSFNRLKLHNDLLYRSWEREKSEIPDDLLCVPESMTENIIKLCHDIPSGGHLGKPKTLAKIQSRFYWPRMELEISLYIDACQTCIKKAQKQKPVSPLQPFNGTHPNDIVHFDLMEAMPDNPYKYRSILVMVDNFTCWVEAVPLRDTKATTIARAFLDNWVARAGVPIQLHSDRGPQFTAEVMQIVYSLIGISKSFTVAYRPQSNSHAESAVKIIKNLLKGFCMENPQNWPNLLQQCLFAYRTSKHSNSNYSPFFLHRGHSARIPMDILFGTFNHKKFKNHQEYAYDLYKTLKKTYSYVEDNLKRNRDFMKRSYDKRVKATPYEPGQYVYLWRPRPPHNKNKFFNHFFGPFKILSKVTDFSFKIDVGNKSRLHPVVPHDLLRPATGYKPSTDEVREYDPINLDLDHTLEIIPESNETQDEDDQNIPNPNNNRPIVFDYTNINPPRALRNRDNIPRPEFYQAGFN